jgi:hypothetical protein
MVQPKVYQGLEDAKINSHEKEKLKGTKEKEKGGRKKDHNLHGSVLWSKLKELVQALFNFFDDKAHGKGF